MPPSAFISYARSTRQAEAVALHEALTRAGVPCFLDREDIGVDQRLPDVLVEGLLSASVVVVFADETYFERPFCRAELRIALTPALALRPGAPLADVAAALAGIVVALPPGGLEEPVFERLSPALRAVHWPEANDVGRLVALVRERLEAKPVSWRERLEAVGLLDSVRFALADEWELPPPGNLAGRRLYPVELPPSLRGAFVGRAEELWRLDAMLSTWRGDPRARAAPAVALEGGGGFGKTRLALEYVHRLGPRRFPGGILWIDADVGPARLESQLHDALRMLRPSVPDLRTFHEQGRSVLTELGRALDELSPGEPLLYVVDNVPEPGPEQPPESLRIYCPAPGRVALLVTSRRRVSLGTGGVQSFPVEALAPEAAVRLLTQGLEQSREPAETWRRVTAWVGQLPLALELLNRVLVLGGLSPGELLARAERSGPAGELDRQMDALRGQVPEGELRGITEALLLSYEKLSEEEQRGARLVAQLSPEPILYELLKALDPEGLSEKVRNALVARSFVTRIAGREKHWFGRMHRVLADFLRNQALDPTEEALHVCRGLVKLLHPAMLREPRLWPLMDLYRPHAEWVFQRLTEEDPSAEPKPLSDVSSYAELGLRIADLLQAEGLPEYAGYYAERAAERADRLLGPEHALSLDGLATLASIFQDLGRLDEALALKTGIVETRRKVHGDEHELTLLAKSNLSVALKALGRWKEALELRQQIFDTCSRRHGAEHRLTLVAMHNLAQSLISDGQHARGRELMERLIQTLRRSHSEDAPQIIDATAHLAVVMHAQGDFAGARKLEERVLHVRRQLLGDEHPLTLTAMANLAVTLKDAGAYSEARPLMEQCVEARTRALGDEHPDVLNTMSNLAALLHDMGDFSGSRRLKEEVLERSRRVLGDEHPQTLTEMNNLVVTLVRMADVKAARPLAEKLVEVARRALGEHSLLALTALGNLGLVLREAGDVSGAKRIYEQQEKLLREQMGENHPSTLAAGQNLAGILRDQGLPHLARERLEKLLEERRKTQGEEHPDTLTALNEFAAVVRDQGDMPRYRELMVQLVATATKVLGEEHAQTLVFMQNLAGANRALGDRQAARKLFEKALEVTIRTQGPESQDATIVAWNLFRLFHDAGMRDEAGKIFAQNLSWLVGRRSEELNEALRDIRTWLLEALRR